MGVRPTSGKLSHPSLLGPAWIRPGWLLAPWPPHAGASSPPTQREYALPIRYRCSRVPWRCDPRTPRIRAASSGDRHRGQPRACHHGVRSCARSHQPDPGPRAPRNGVSRRRLLLRCQPGRARCPPHRHRGDVPRGMRHARSAESAGRRLPYRLDSTTGPRGPLAPSGCPGLGSRGITAIATCCPDPRRTPYDTAETPRSSSLPQAPKNPHYQPAIHRHPPTPRKPRQSGASQGGVAKIPTKSSGGHIIGQTT